MFLKTISVAHITFLLPKNIPSYGYTQFYLPTHQLMDILVVPISLANRNTAALDISVQIFVQTHASFLLGILLGMELLDHMVTLCFTLRSFWTIFHCTFPLAICVGPRISASLPTLAVVHTFYYSHPSVCKVVSHCGLEFHFLITNDIVPLFMYFLGHLYNFLGEMPFQIFQLWAHF